MKLSHQTARGAVARREHAGRARHGGARRAWAWARRTPLRRGEAVAAAEEAFDVAHLVHDRGVGDAVLVDGADLERGPVLAAHGHVPPVALPVLALLGRVDGEAVLVDPVLLAAEVDKLVAPAHVGQHELALLVHRVGPVEERARRGRRHGHRRLQRRNRRRRPTHAGPLGRLRGDVRLPTLAAEQLEVAHAVGHGARSARVATRRYRPPLALPISRLSYGLVGER